MGRAALGAHLTQALSLLACTCFLSPLKTEGSQAPWPWPARNTSLVTETMLISLSGTWRPKEVSELMNGELGLEPQLFASPNHPSTRK